MTQAPLSRIVSKAFLRPHETPEAEVAKVILDGGGIQESFYTRYHQLRLGKASWLSPGCGAIPDGLEAPPVWWITPWASKPRQPIGCWELFRRWLAYPDLFDTFLSIVEATDSARAWIGPPAKVIRLLRGNESLHILLDGHHRLGALAAVRPDDGVVPVEVASTWDYEGTILEGYLSEADRVTWWDHLTRIQDE